ncbi:hypothetical protein Sjap_019723 [Stephania japonica]|uniref:Protein BIG GRAIN 1-like A n=1 Tax=Stephania japonica TaxID=461633 RepID=A0AAP0EZZ7_9MAGN
MTMDHQWSKSLRVDDKPRRGTKNPSFSSTLLDAIYRSIDEGVEGEEELVLYRETMKKKQQSSSSSSTTNGGFRGRNSMKIGEDDEEQIASLRRACLIEKWMEKKVMSEKVVVRRKSVPDHKTTLHSTSSSSSSSSGGGFSSSEADESVRGSRSRSSSSFTSQPRPKPIRTSVVSASSATYTTNEQRSSSRSSSSSSSNVYDILRNDRYSANNNPQQKQQSKELGGGFNKTKSRALKIYGDLKKVKHPISPGGRLASFLNSIFTTGNPKKPKIERADDLISSHQSKSAQTSTSCSSASSFSRSCLSKTPSSRGKPINGIKRSVRFYPVSVIVDEDSRPCGHKNLYEQQEQHQSRLMALDDELKHRVMEKNRRIEEAARDLLSNYRDQMIKKNSDQQCDLEMRDRDLQRNYEHIEDEDEDDDDDDDDTASYSSSDLFELDNLGSIGIERYREELPVYETTHLETNRAIANGLIL